MENNRPSFAYTVLAMAVGALLATAMGSGPAVAQQAAAAAPPGINELTTRVNSIEKAWRSFATDITYLKNYVKQQQAASGPNAAGGTKSLDAKIEDLKKKLESHTHEYLLEGRGSDGSIRAVTQDQFNGSGLNSTGGARVGKAIIH